MSLPHRNSDQELRDRLEALGYTPLDWQLEFVQLVMAGDYIGAWGMNYGRRYVFKMANALMLEFAAHD